MWISKKEYDFLKMQEKMNLKNKDLLEEITNMYQRNSKKVKEIYEIKKELKYYLDMNEEKGVVYIPRFVIEKILIGL